MFQSDKPSAPENFSVAGTTENTVSLKWQEPDDNGGCLIKQYVVEKTRGNETNVAT